MDLARAECARWAGTPHRNRIAVVGQGVDCLRFVFEVLIAAGVLPRFTLPRYDERLGILREKNVMEALILTHCHATVETEPAFGDVVIFKCGAQSNHAGIIIDGECWHVPGRSRVGTEEWANVRKVTQSLLRLTATGFRESPEGLTWEKIRLTL